MHRARAATVVHLPCECSPGKDHAGRPGVCGGGRAVKGATLWRRDAGMAGRTGLPACGGCRGDWASYSSSGQLRERHLGGRQRGPASRAFSGSHPQTIFRARNDDRESREGHEVDVHDHRGIWTSTTANVSSSCAYVSPPELGCGSRATQVDRRPAQKIRRDTAGRRERLELIMRGVGAPERCEGQRSDRSPPTAPRPSRWPTLLARHAELTSCTCRQT